MDCVERVIAKLKAREHTEGVFVPTADQKEIIFKAEGGVKAGTGMPIRNDSLEEARKRQHNLVLVSSVGGDFGWVPHHNMTWEDSRGNVVAFDVPDALRYEIDGRDDLIWISEDFVMDPNVLGSDELTIVFHPAPITIVGEEEGVKDAILMFPAAPVDDVIRMMFGVEHTPRVNTSILSFNEI